MEINLQRLIFELFHSTLEIYLPFITLKEALFLFLGFFFFALTFPPLFIIFFFSVFV